MNLSDFAGVCSCLQPVWMASHSAETSRDKGAPPPVASGAPANAAGAPVDTEHLDRLVEMALTAGKSGRHVLAATFYRHAADEALRLDGETFVCTYLTLQRSNQLCMQSHLEGVLKEERTALRDEAWTLVSSCLPLVVRRMDANTMLPGRGTAAELAFGKRFEATKNATFDAPTMPACGLQLAGLSLGYATAVYAANLLFSFLVYRHDVEAQAFVVRVVDCMLLAARSLPALTHGQETDFASTMQKVISGAYIDL